MRRSSYVPSHPNSFVRLRLFDEAMKELNKMASRPFLRAVN